MSLDLSKLAVLELPSKTININICGEEQSVEVRALDDECSLKIIGISADDKLSDGEKQLAIRRIVLKNSVLPPLTEEEIDLLMRKAASGVTELYVAASKLTQEFGEARRKVAADAKKNSSQTAEMTTAG